MMRKLKTFISKLVKRAINFYEDQNLLEEKIFWGIVPLTTLVGLMSLIGTICENFSVASIVSASFCTFIPLMIAIICYIDHNQCRKYYVVFCYVMNCVLVPSTFIIKGGMFSGMVFYCFGFLLMCCFCTNPHDRHWTSFASFTVYVSLFLFVWIYPEAEVQIPDSFRRIDMIFSFAAAAISMIIIISEAINQYNRQRYRQVNDGLIDSMGTIIEFRSLETGNHIHNIRQFTAILLKCANETIEGVHFSKAEIETISAAAMLHDIGKISVPDSILSKPGKLTEQEYAIMKKHPLDGCRMIESMKDYQNHQYYKYSYEICRHHHEHYDGTGYPDGLKGDGIPLISQIVALADVYEALIAKRVYKEPYSFEKAASIINASKGTMFSSDMVKVFNKAREQLEVLILKDNSKNQKL